MSNVGEFVLSKIGMLDIDMPSSRAMLAKLRRACGKPPGARADIFEVTLEGAPQENLAINAIHAALTLYGVHKQGARKSMNEMRLPFGGAVGRLVEKDESNIASVKRRFDSVLTASDLNEAAHYARGLVQMLRGKDIGFNYASFANGLYSFQFPNGADRVRLKWGQDFYKEITSKNEGGITNE